MICGKRSQFYVHFLSLISQFDRFLIVKVLVGSLTSLVQAQNCSRLLSPCPGDGSVGRGCDNRWGHGAVIGQLGSRDLVPSCDWSTGDVSQVRAGDQLLPTHALNFSAFHNILYLSAVKSRTKTRSRTFCFDSTKVTIEIDRNLPRIQTTR